MEKIFSNIGGRIVAGIDSKSIEIKDFLNLNPKDFSWKMRWRMKHDQNPLFVEVQDKYKVKSYAQKRGVQTAAVFHVTDNPATIPFDSLPDNYFIKANHGCGWNILCKEREFYIHSTKVNLAKIADSQKYKISRQEVLKYCQSWLNTTYSKRQWAYQQISPLIVLEEVLVPKSSEEIIDYKIYTFNGFARVIQILDTTIRQNNENILLDPGWREFKLPDDKYSHPEILPQKPDTLEEMVSAAEKLGQGLDFIRVDLYDTMRGVILGEMTVYPEGGRLNSASYDPAFNRWLGDQWDLPSA